MRLTTPIAIALVFVAGIVASPLLEHVVADAHAQSAPLALPMIYQMSIEHADLPTTPNRR
jgi:hypothetical protein